MKNKQTLRQFLGIKVEKGKPFIITHNGKEVYGECANGYWWRHEYDSDGNETYYEDHSGYWYKYEYGSDGNVIYYEDHSGYWWKKEYDSEGNETYYENSNGFWWKGEYDTKGNLIYREDPEGTTYDIRPKELTMDEIADKFGIPVSQLKIKK